MGYLALLLAGSDYTLLDRKCELDQMVKDERKGLEEDLQERLEDGLADAEQRLRQLENAFAFLVRVSADVLVVSFQEYIFLVSKLEAFPTSIP